MSFDFEQMQKSKDALRQRLAAAPIAEKLRMLDTLRERALTIRSAVIRESGSVHETPGYYKWRRDQ